MIRRTTENSHQENKTWLSESNINQQDFSKIRTPFADLSCFQQDFLDQLAYFL
jgi:hypothetical protein